MDGQMMDTASNGSGTDSKGMQGSDSGILGNLNGPVVRQVDTVLLRAIELGASDIHFEPFEQQLRVRYRLDGILMKACELSVHQKDAIISRVKIMANLDIAEKRRPQDGRIQYGNRKDRVDLRLSTLPTAFGEKVVIRILDRQKQSLGLQDLGFGESELGLFRKAIHFPYGMILVTGPTGSGKTTTLYAALNELNSEEGNITSVEDPVEYELDGVNQTQIHTDIGVNFATSLRSILRQDPDIIMIGEIRDRQTADIAVRSALTGHMVLTTLHTNDAPSAITRLVDMGIKPFLLAASLRLIVAQRLVRKVCPSCSTDVGHDTSLLDELPAGSLPASYKQGSGCEYCNHTGYQGRTALTELMPVSSVIAGKISNGSDTNELRKCAEAEGLAGLKESGIEKIGAGITTPGEVFRQII